MFARSTPDLHRNDIRTSPMRRLAVRIVAEAWSTALHPISRSCSLRDRTDAREWFFSEQQDLGSFVWIAEFLNISPSAVRRRLASLVNEHSCAGIMTGKPKKLPAPPTETLIEMLDQMTLTALAQYFGVSISTAWQWTKDLPNTSSKVRHRKRLQVAEARAKGLSLAQIAREVGLSPTSVARYLKIQRVHKKPTATIINGLSGAEG